MTEFDLVIRNGKIATAADVMNCDIGIHQGQIVALAAELPKGTQEIDATDKLVLPGGVDAHCHMDQPMNDGSVMADDFYTGTLSALCGGTTTVIPFACQMKGHSLAKAVEDYHQRATDKAVIDYAFHLIVTDPTPHVLDEELPKLIAKGYTSFKVYMTYDDLKLSDRALLDVLAVARQEGAFVMVHAENSDCIAWMVQRLAQLGKISPRYHATARPQVVEREATHRAIALAELVDVPILIVHVSGAEAVEQIQWAQNRGLRIYAETCPQYLFLTEADLDQPGFEGAKCICSPPPRDKANQQVIWDGLCNGVFQVISSDHAPFRYAHPQGKQICGTHGSFQYVPNGIPGIETRLPLLFSEGVNQGRIDLNTFVALTATNPAKLYGLYPQKGTIAIGSDADLVIWDTQRQVTIANEMLHHNVDYTPYEGIALQGYPEITISRGEIVYQHGEVIAQKGRGKFLSCGLSSFARPRQRGKAVPCP
ncbi:dihydropyrimidinase [Chroogloeocystis siderophila]|uniref:D-hydantoinase n=1 Tax=Chroogloeocystis siderophila 5.2 s.c.1 TaxID=247279 RepID=A0A1U7HP86_9CHRO|nr:dihydropyrimidinase [Chroogloeocystis siderophila]OKH25381.1 dihydropyrimidinase [Chroogloeocystis siderophila 5.2 s.c.1]